MVSPIKAATLGHVFPSACISADLRPNSFAFGFGFCSLLLPVAHGLSSVGVALFLAVACCLWPVACGACGLHRMRIKKAPKSDSDWVNCFIHNKKIGKSEPGLISENVAQIVNIHGYIH